MKRQKRKRKFSFLLSLNAGLILFACFLFSALIVLAVIFLSDLIYKGSFRDNPVLLVALGFLATMAVGSLTLFIVMRMLSGKFDNARNIIRKIADGDYSEKIPLPRQENVLYEVVQDFNKMVDRLNSTALLQSDFANNFSHEFKTPLVSVKGYAELLQKRPDLPQSERDKYLKIIIDEADRLAGLASSTLLLSRLDSSTALTEITAVRVDEQIGECILLLDAEFRKKNMETDIELAPFTVMSNADMLKEVWINLLSNAVKYGRTNGTVTVRSAVTDTCYMVTVRDDGAGMNEKTLTHVFDKYYQGENAKGVRGNGLGLSIAKMIVLLSGGDITVKSAPGRGSTFTVIFPKPAARRERH